MRISDPALPPVFFDEYGIKYSADRKKLIKWEKKLYNYNILEGTVMICDGAFNGCKSLGSITSPDSVTLVGDRAFYGCENLKSIIITIPQKIL